MAWHVPRLLLTCCRRPDQTDRPKAYPSGSGVRTHGCRTSSHADAANLAASHGPLPVSSHRAGAVALLCPLPCHVDRRKGDGWLAARAPPEVQPKWTGQTHSWRQRGGGTKWTDGAFSTEFRGGTSRRCRGIREASSHTPGWLVACLPRAPFLPSFHCRNSLTPPPLPQFRVSTEHTKCDGKSRPQHELPCLSPLPFAVL